MRPRLAVRFSQVRLLRLCFVEPLRRCQLWFSEGKRIEYDLVPFLKTFLDDREYIVAVAEHERLVLQAGGIVVRYGTLYGPSTYWEPGRIPPPPRIHVEEAARHTVALVEAASGVVVVAEEP